jgi:3-phosphoshikimate 1-carboxyvinyltransferase
MRLLCGLLGAQRFASILTGDSSLRSRPMRRVAEPLAAMGASIAGEAGARPGELYPPLRIAAAPGPLRGISYSLPIASAQVKSALLLAALYADGETRLSEPGPSRDHTERMLRYLGCPVATDGAGTTRLVPTGWDRRLEARPIDVPGDPSSSAFLVAAGLVVGAGPVMVRRVCVNPTRTGFLDALRAMGASIAETLTTEGGPEPVADLVARGGPAELTAADVSGELMVRSLDEIPILAVVAARASGTTWFRDAAELRVKESDRIATTAAMLRAFGVEVEERADAFAVQGMAGRPFKAARVDAAGDHRIAMAAAIAALAADGPSRIDDVANVATSFPTFVDLLQILGARIARSS